MHLSSIVADKITPDLYNKILEKSVLMGGG